jgi:tripartite-type tricarboxylate transporter receptor subunit TctC
VRNARAYTEVDTMTNCLSLVRRLFPAALAFIAAISLNAAARADEWPSRPVRVLVGFAAGGNIDNLARLTCARLSKIFGQQFVIENRAGATGAIAAEAAAHAAPDGYTFFWAGTGTVSILPFMTKLTYDTVKDFEPISVIGYSPQVLIVNPNVPAKTVPEFIAYVKAQPGKLSYAGGGGPGSVGNLLMSLFLKRAGLTMIDVSYRGTAPAMTDVIAGHIPTMFSPLPEAIVQGRAGKVRMLATSGEQRSVQIPDVPTIAESGFPGYQGTSWNAMMAPTGTPKEIVDKIAAEFVKAVKDPEFVKQLDKYGADPLGMTPAQFTEFLAKDRALWSEAVEIAGLKLQ